MGKFDNLRKAIARAIYPEIFITPKEKLIESPKEEYYNNKYPKSDIIYKGRVVPNSSNKVGIDIRNFFTINDSQVKKITGDLDLEGKSDDEKALECLSWIIKNIKYVTDDTKGYNEFWQFPFETIYYKTGDCEDGAILLANLMMVSGIPYWKIRLSAGWVIYNGSKAGHCYLTYYCEDQDKWVVLDWCYWPNLKSIKNRNDYKVEGNYLDIWFSWSNKYCFTQGLNTQAKKILM